MSILRIKDQFIDQESGTQGFISEDGTVYLSLNSKYVDKEELQAAPHIYGLAMKSAEGIQLIVDIYVKAENYFNGKKNEDEKPTSTDIISDIVPTKSPERVEVLVGTDATGTELVVEKIEESNSETENQPKVRKRRGAKK